MQEEDSHMDQDVSPAPKTSIPVMSDVKPPESVVTETVSSDTVSDSHMATPPADDVMPDLASESASSSEVTPAQAAPVTPVAADAIKKNGMGMVIGIVVGVVIVLAAVGYFAFMKKDKATSSASKTSTTAKADPAAASSTIDSNLSSLDQSKDFNSADLNDTTLGL